MLHSEASSCKTISILSRQKLKMPSDNGQGDVWAGQKVILTSTKCNN